MKNSVLQGCIPQARYWRPLRWIQPMINNKAFSVSKFPRTIGALLAAVMVLGISSRAIAQTPELEVYYDRFDPKAPFSYKWNGEVKNCNVGAFHWLIPPSEFGTGGLDRNFTGYC